jgi:hypothetical protein
VFYSLSPVANNDEKTEVQESPEGERKILLRKYIEEKGKMLSSPKSRARRVVKVSVEKPGKLREIDDREFHIQC